MPNYDIIPLAVDLLDYTIQRVKTKEPEYRKVKALVQENLRKENFLRKSVMTESRTFRKVRHFTCAPVLRSVQSPFWKSASPQTADILKRILRTGSKTLMPCWLLVTPCSSTSTSVSRKSTSRVTSATIGRSLSARYGKKPLVGAAMTETVRRLCVRQSVPMNLLK